MDDEAEERFKREALTAARLKHPHVVTIYDFDVAEDVGAFLVMELLKRAHPARRDHAGGAA